MACPKVVGVLGDHVRKCTWRGNLQAFYVLIEAVHEVITTVAHPLTFQITRFDAIMLESPTVAATLLITLLWLRWPCWTSLQSTNGQRRSAEGES